MGIVNVGVIGAGYLGKFHAEKYASLANCNLIAIADINEQTANEIADTHINAKAYTDHSALLDIVDAVSIVTFTDSHYAIAKDFLQRGKHVLSEKPMTSDQPQAEELIQLAKQHNAVLQIGHIERFNPTVLALDERLEDVKFIESHRLSPFRARGTDVNVVLDLMIHDIDIILSIVKSDIRCIDSSGMQVLSDGIDIANAHITFENDCVANVTASRVSDKSERKLRLFQTNAYFSCDLGNHSLKAYTRQAGEIKPESFSFEKQDALLAEVTHFLQCIENNSTPLVSGIDGLRALKTAHEIASNMKIHTST